MIKNLIFDFGKVLVQYDFPSIIHTWFEYPEREAEFNRVVMTHEWQCIQDIELKPWSEVIEDMKAETPQFIAEIDRFDKEYQKFVLGEMPGMKDLLIELKEKGYRLLGLSNWSSRVYETMANYDIFNLLEGSVISNEVHLLKPDPQIFTLTLDKFGIKAEETIFADDRADNIEGARSVGIDAVLFTDCEAFKKELATRGIDLK